MRFGCIELVNAAILLRTEECSNRVIQSRAVSVDEVLRDLGIFANQVDRWTALVDESAIIDNVMLDASSGEQPTLGVNPIVECRLSRDQGNNFGPWRQSFIGKQGDTRTRIGWRRWGLIDNEGAVFDFRITDTTPWRVSSIKMNEGQSGRGRGSSG